MGVPAVQAPGEVGKRRVCSVFFCIFLYCVGVMRSRSGLLGLAGLQAV